MDIQAIQKSYNNGEYNLHPLEDNNMLPDNHVFDGEKSVNWNKAELANENTRRVN